MLRSMLYVRYGCGCSRRVRASAARPIAARSCDSKSRRPSSGARRSPATAFSRIGWVAQAIIRSRGSCRHGKPVLGWGKSQSHGFFVKQFQALALARAEIEMQVVAEVGQALWHG